MIKTSFRSSSLVSVPLVNDTESQEKRKVRPSGRLTEDRLNEIAAKAAALFIERGYEAVSIDEIIAEIGGSKSTVYAKLGGKSGLFVLAIEHHCEMVSDSISRALVHEQADSLEEQLMRVGEAFLQLILDEKTLKLHRLIVSLGDSFPALSRTFYDAGPGAAYRLIATWMTQQQEAGLLIDGDPHLLSSLFLDMLTGRYQLSALTVHSPPNAAEIRSTVFLASRIFLQGATPMPAKPRNDNR